MSLTKLLMAPVKLFKKDVITFLIIRRYDLGRTEDSLRYISVRPNASVSVLRQKVWYLLDLPDYCEEIIVLKNREDLEISLTEMRKGNDPQHPYILEVWMPGKRFRSTCTLHNNMLTMGHEADRIAENNCANSETTCGENDERIHTDNEKASNENISRITASYETVALNKAHFKDNKRKLNINNFLRSDCKNSGLSCRISSTSMLFKLQGQASVDQFANVLMKIQNDLSALSSKLSSLENRIST